MEEFTCETRSKYLYVVVKQIEPGGDGGCVAAKCVLGKKRNAGCREEILSSVVINNEIIWSYLIQWSNKVVLR